jgi:hypothetical protein
LSKRREKPLSQTIQPIQQRRRRAGAIRRGLGKGPTGAQNYGSQYDPHKMLAPHGAIPPQENNVENSKSSCGIGRNDFVGLTEFSQSRDI